MKSFIAAITLSVASALDNMEVKYILHMAKFGKQVNSTSEFNERLEFFRANDDYITTHNAGKHNFTVGHNQFSDWSRQEYKAMLGRKPTPESAKKNIVKFDESSNDMTVDWRAAGAVTPVKDQAACGSCWAFSSTGALEGENFIQTGELVSFSEQQLVSCVSGCYGCGGGWQYKSFDYWKTTPAVKEEDYPYTSGSGITGSCQYVASMATDTMVSTEGFVTASNVDQMKAAIAVQPLAVSIEADQPCFQNYQSGVMDDTSCGTYIDHAVLAVGWGNDSASGLDYWLVKNSWNTSWGDEGYIKIAIVDGVGICAIQYEPETLTSTTS